MRCNREELLLKLESVNSGLSSRDVIDQSSCFAFQGDLVMTFNGEDACQQKCKTGITGAVKAAQLLAILRKYSEDEIELETGEGELIVIGKKKRSGILMEKEVLLPIDKVEQPTEWTKLRDDFTDALTIVAQCTGKDESCFTTTCVHITPKWIEGYDNYQIARYKMKTKFKENALIRATAAQNVVALGMIEFAETPAWIHFRNDSGLQLSCCRFLEEYRDLSPYLECKGTPTVLPKGLAEACEKAEVFSKDNTEDNYVRIELRPGKLRLQGEGAYGWHSEVRKIKYNGDTMTFRMSPLLLSELTKRFSECEIGKDRLKVDGGKFVYVACLEKETGK